jgi:hypothetical protein
VRQAGNPRAQTEIAGRSRAPKHIQEGTDGTGDTSTLFLRGKLGELIRDMTEHAREVTLPRFANTAPDCAEWEREMGYATGGEKGCA